MRAPRRDVATIAAGVTSAANGSVTIVEDGSSTRLMCRRKERKGPSMGRLARPSHFSHGNSHKQLHPILQCSNPKAEPPGQRQLARPRQDKRSRQPSHLWELQWPTPSQATWKKLPFLSNRTGGAAPRGGQGEGGLAGSRQGPPASQPSHARKTSSYRQGKDWQDAEEGG